MSVFNWAIVGTGGIAERFASVLCQSDKYGKIKGVLGTSESKALAFMRSSARGLVAEPNCYTNISELIEDGGVDAVYVATPHPSHYTLTAALLKAKKPVLCEKPLTINSKQASELVALSGESHTFLMEALWTKTLPIWRRIESIFEADQIGIVDNYSCDLSYYFPFEPKHRLFNRELGGGVTLDLAVYPVALANALSGVPTGILASTVLCETGVDAKTSIALTFEDGVTGLFYSSCHSNSEGVFRITGSKGILEAHNLFSGGAQSIILNIDGIRAEEVFEFDVNGFEYQISEAISCVRAGKTQSDLVPHKNTLEVLRVLDAVGNQIGLNYSESSL